MLNAIKIRNYRNLKNVKLTNLKKFNFIIGPSNCGKTNILRSIESITKIDIKDGRSFDGTGDCKCNEILSIWNDQNYNEDIRKFRLCGGDIHIPIVEMYKKKEKVKIEYNLNEEFFEKINRDLTPKEFEDRMSEAIKTSNYKLATQDNVRGHLKDLDLSSLVVEQRFKNSEPKVKHISWFSNQKTADYIKERIVFIEDSRLQNYKNVSISKYITKLNLSGNKFRSLISFLSEIIDPNIKDYKQNSLELVFEDDFVDQIDSQGSGVRSLICLAVDLLSAKNNSIVLIDEPELGLNPHTKQAFLKFLLNEKSKQIFVSTHDPTFLNPIIWDDKDVAVYFFSPIYDGNSTDKEEPNFVKVNLEQSREDPHIFSGYLPHTDSLKKIHFYAEGKEDVYALQEYLSEHFQKSEGRDWLKLFNNIGIHHLAGSFWKHLLYTIPKEPYRCIVILDNDKLDEAKKVCKYYSKIRLNAPSFVFCKTIAEINNVLIKGNCPVYCLSHGCLEDAGEDPIIKKELESIMTPMLSD